MYTQIYSEQFTRSMVLIIMNPLLVKSVFFTYSGDAK